MPKSKSWSRDNQQNNSHIAFNIASPLRRVWRISPGRSQGRRARTVADTLRNLDDLLNGAVLDDGSDGCEHYALINMTIFIETHMLAGYTL